MEIHDQQNTDEGNKFLIGKWIDFCTQLNFQSLSN